MVGMILLILCWIYTFNKSIYDKYMRRHFLKTSVLILITVTVAAIIISLPFALKDILTDLSSESHPMYWLSSQEQPQTDKHLSVHLDFIGINEWDGTAKIRMTAYDYCINPCTWTDEITLVSIQNQVTGASLAPAETIQFSSNHWSYTKVIDLPIYGDPIRFPFDDYDMRLGILYHRLYPGGYVEEITPEMAKTQLSVSLQSRIPKFFMLTPQNLSNPTAVLYGDHIQRYDYATDLTFARHSYLKILTVFLILLIAAVTAYAVFFCDFRSVILSAGGLILGIWGIKAILLSDAQAGITISDVFLAVIVLFLLIAVIIRAAYHEGLFDRLKQKRKK